MLAGKRLGVVTFPYKIQVMDKFFSIFKVTYFAEIHLYLPRSVLELLTLKSHKPSHQWVLHIVICRGHIKNYAVIKKHCIDIFGLD